MRARSATRRAQKPGGASAPSRTGRPRRRPPDGLGTVLRDIVAGTGDTGEAFFESLVVCLSRALGVRHALVGEITGAAGDAIRTVGFATDGVLQPAATYALQGTPCASVAAGALCYHPSGVQAHFPEDPLLVDLKAESYLGIPLRSSTGAPLGILAVLHDAPLRRAVDPAVVLQIFAGRAGAELERHRSERLLREREAALRLSEERFARIFHASPVSIVIARLDARGIIDANQAMLDTFGYRREEVIGRTAVELGLWTEESRAAWEARLLRSGRFTNEVVEMSTPQGARSMLLAAELIELEGERCSLVLGLDVTEWMAAERKQRESEERLALALEAARMGAWEREIATNRLAWTDRENRVCGFPEGTTIRTLDDYLGRLHPDDRPRLRQAASEAIAGVRPQYTIEHRVQAADGTWRWIEGRGQVFHDRAGRPVRLAGTIVDITERKRTERQLRESEERWRRLSEGTSEGLGIHRQGILVDVNTQLGQMLGYEPEELIGRNLMELVAPESRDLVRERVAAHSEGPYEHMALKKDGARIPVEVRARLVQSGSPPLRMGIIRDLSETRRLEADLRTAAREWNECFDALPLGLLLLDEAGIVRRANRPALVQSGRTRFRGLIGRHIAGLGRGEPWLSLVRLAGGERVGGPISIDEAVDPETGTAWRVSSAPLVREGERTSWTILLFHDVTETARLRNDLTRQEALAAMGSLIGGVAHEVRTPLFSISATLDAFEGSSADEMAEGTRRLRAQVKRLSQLMTDLLDYGKPPSLQLEAGGVAEVIDRAAHSVAATAAQAGVALHLDLPADLPAVRRDSRRLEQALQNLVTNAVQHTPRGTVVRVSARPVRRGALEALETRVEDEGPGIPEAALPHVFEPFFSRRKGGTGLGLSIVHRIAEAHGGEVSAANRLRGGAVFTLTLPVVRDGGGDDV